MEWKCSMVENKMLIDLKKGSTYQTTRWLLSPLPPPWSRKLLSKVLSHLLHILSTQKSVPVIFFHHHHIFFANFSTNILQKFAQISPLSQTRIVSKNNFYEPVLVYLHPPLTLRLCPLYIRVSRHKLIKRRGLIYRDPKMPIVVIDHIWSRVFVVCCK